MRIRPRSSSAIADTHSSSRWRSWETITHGAVEAGHEPLELVAAAHVEVRLGLVEQQHVRAAGEAGGERDELALAAGELARCGSASASSARPRSAQVHPRASPSTRSPPCVGPARRAAAPGGRARGVIASRSAASAGSARRVLGRGELGLELGELGPRRAHGRERRRGRRRRPPAAGTRATSPRRRVTVPASACSTPARMRSSVDLPPPLGPSTPMRAPSATSRSSAVEDAAAAEGLDEPARGEQRDRRRRASPLRGSGHAPPAGPARATSRSSHPWTVTSRPSGSL